MGDRLATRFRDTNAQLRSLRNETNSRIGATVETINEYARKLQELNRQIFSYEAGGSRHANDARDERDRTLESLSKLVDLNWVEGKDGMLTVFIGRDWTLVQGNKANELVASLKGGEIGMYRVEGKLSRESRRDITEIFRAGEMQELTEVRDKTIVKYMDDLNDLAFGLTSKINQLHATGTGLKSASNMMKSAYGLNAEARLQPLPFLKDGIFQLHLVDRENEFVETYEIEIQAGRDTLNDIVQRINQTVNAPELLYASVEEDGSMFIQTGTDYKFIFGDDKTDLTQVLGFNSFFETLKGAEDLRLSDRIMLDPNTISTGRDLYPGDNRVALDIAKLQTDPHMRNDTMTFDEFYNTILADLGLRIQRNQTEKAQQDSLVNQFSQIRSSISGVNMDEELAKMMQYQKAYEASARFVGTVDQMMDTLVRM
jgi:flagellar hook-associated protein 1 FlgK